MDMLKYCFFIALLLFPVSAAQAKTFNAESFTLENGLQVVVIPNHRAPVVTHMIWYRVGAADEPPGLSGMAHYFEHLMFKGTEKLAPGEFSKTVKTLGGNDNAFTSQDYTAYYQSIASEHLEKVMSMEADRMLNLAPPPDHYASEKQVVLEERRQRTENDPRGLFSEQMQSALFINHPYAIPVIGWMDEIKEYEWEDVKSFYDRWYAPNNAIVVISGDVTAGLVKPMAERIYGTLPTKEIPERRRPNVPPAIGDTHMTLHDPTIHQPALQKVYLSPSYNQNAQDSLALQVLEDVLSNGPTSRLYKSLVVEQKIATSVGFSYRANALDYASTWLSATPAPGISLEQLEEAVDAELRKVVEEGITDAELKDSIQRMQDEAVFARDSLTGPAMIFGFALVTGSVIDDVETWTDKIAAVSAQQVHEAAKTYLNPKESWIRPPISGYMLPPEVEEKSPAAGETAPEEEAAE